MFLLKATVPAIGANLPHRDTEATIGLKSDGLLDTVDAASRKHVLVDVNKGFILQGVVVEERGRKRWKVREKVK